MIVTEPCFASSVNNENQARRNLWAAVMELGLLDARDALEHLGDPPEKPTDIYVDRLRARRWLFSNEIYTGSFVCICAALDLDPQRVRGFVVSEKDFKKDAYIQFRVKSDTPRRKGKNSP